MVIQNRSGFGYCVLSGSVDEFQSLTSLLRYHVDMKLDDVERVQSEYE